MKKYFVSILVMLGLVLFFCYYLIGEFRYSQEVIKIYEEMLPTCEEKNNCEDIQKYIENAKIESLDAITLFIADTKTATAKFLFLPIIIFSLATFSVYRLVKSGFYKNELTRTSYQKEKRNIYFDAIKKTIFIVPCAFLLFFFICIIATQGNFDYLNTRNLQLIEYYYQHFGQFLLLYFSIIVFHMLLCVNIAFICLKKSSNFLIGTFKSFVFYMALQIILEFFVGGIFIRKILGIENIASNFSLIASWQVDEFTNLGLVLSIMVVLYLLTTLFLHYYYRDKEKFIICNEEAS